MNHDSPKKHDLSHQATKSLLAGSQQGSNHALPPEPADPDYPSEFPPAISSILSKLPYLQNKRITEAIESQIQRQALRKNWIKIVGPKLSEHTAPLALQNHKLIVAVDEPKWMVALQQIEALLSKKVNEFLNASQPISLELRLKRVFPKPLPNLSSSSKVEAEQQPAKITAEREAEIDRLLGPIKNNDRLKQTLRGILIKHCLHDQHFLEKN
ncbi:MAG: DUF721 domain-containing protein [bacterium]|nr:DUF721 domain-containing protein [bacterium]